MDCRATAAAVVVAVTREESPVGTLAVIWHAPTVAEKMDTTVEELRAALERAPGLSSAVR